jgi:hypothetical protein
VDEDQLPGPFHKASRQGINTHESAQHHRNSAWAKFVTAGFTITATVLAAINMIPPAQREALLNTFKNLAK